MELRSSAKITALLPVGLFLLALALRLPFTSKLLFHHDSVNFALALEHYDIRLHQPHPPGYFLYVLLGRLVHLFIPDANLALIAISMVATSLAVVFVYLLAKEMYDLRTAVIAALLAVASPNLWFHGEVALSYGVEAFFSAVVGYLCWHAYRGRGQLVLVAAVTLALSGGFRQSTLVFLLPLWLLSLSKVETRKALAAVTLLVALCLAWFGGMVWMSGGVEAYLASFQDIWESNTGHSSFFEIGWRSLVFYGKTLLAFNLYSLGAGAVLIATAAWGAVRRGELGSLFRGTGRFYLAWLLPAYLFFQFIFLHNANPGYVLILLPPLLLLCSRTVVKTAEALQTTCTAPFLPVLTAAVLVGNTCFFLCSDYPVSWRTLKQHDRDLATVLRCVERFEAGTTAVILKPYVFYGFRMIMYYLPQYHVYNLACSGCSPGKGVFWGVGRRTFLTPRLQLPPAMGNAVTFDFDHTAKAGWVPTGVAGISLTCGPASEILRQLQPARPIPVSPLQ